MTWLYRALGIMMHNKKRYKIAYVTSIDPKDASHSSGIYYFQRKAMEKHIGELDLLGPVKSPLINRFKKVLPNLFNCRPGKYNLYHSLLISKAYGRIFNRRIGNRKYDFIFGDRASCEMAYLNTDIPIIYSTDATFDGVLNYYPAFENLGNISIYEGNKVESKLLNKASLIICASSWASNSVIDKYKIEPQKVFVLPRGANLEADPNIEQTPASNHDTCKLLFVGKSWKRKGGDIAYKTFLELKKMNINVHLTIIGFSPSINDPDVSIIPYINKNLEEDRDRYDRILRETTFLLLPTRAECMGIAFSEASAYGIPVFSTNTGGVSSAVLDGKTGYLLPIDSTGKDYADRIKKLFIDKEKYRVFRKASIEHYKRTLNWDSWARELKEILDRTTIS